jgi:hypothetical protein
MGWGATTRLGKALLAIVIGNIVYFWAMPHLPYSWQHHSLDIDFGLAVDFFLCGVVYIILDAAFRPSEKR